MAYKYIIVESAQEMYEAVLSHFAEVDIVIKSAAVADYRPKLMYDHKIKKKPGEQVIELERTNGYSNRVLEKKRINKFSSALQLKPIILKNMQKKT